MADTKIAGLTSPITQEEFEARGMPVGKISGLDVTPDMVNATAAMVNNPDTTFDVAPQGDSENELTPEDWQAEASTITDTPSEDVQSGLYAVKDVNPDQYAKDRGTANKIGVPVETVQADPKAAEDQARFQDNEYFQNMKRQSPVLAEAIANDKELASMAHDDIENLQGVTGFFKATGKVYSGADASTKQMVDLGNRLLWGKDDITEEEVAKLDEAQMQQIPNDYGYSSMPSSIWMATVGQVPIQEEVLKQGITGGGPAAAAGAAVGGIIGGGAAFFTAGPEAVPAAAFQGAKTGAKFLGRGGFAVGSFKAAAELEGGSALQEFATMKDEDGNRMSLDAAKSAARAVGYINGAIELGGEAVYLKNIPGINKLLPEKLTGAAAAAEVRQQVKMGLRNKTIREALIQTGKKYAEGLTAETATEMLQEVVTILGGGQAKDASGQEYAPVATEDQVKRVAQTGVQALESMVLLNAPGPTIGLYQDKRAIDKAQAAKAKIEAFAKDVQASKLNTRAPDKMELLISKAKQDSENKSVYIPLDKFTEYFQSQKMDPDAVAEELGITEQLKAAKEGGGQVEIPVEIYATKLIPSQHYQGLLNDTKFDPNGFTVNEAQVAQKEYEARVTEEVKRVQAEAAKTDGERSVRAQIYDDAFKKLIDIGKPEGEARKLSELIAARYAAVGERSGIDPLKIYQETNVQFRRALPESLDATDEPRLRNLITRIQEPEAYVKPEGKDQIASDAQAVQDLQRFGESLGIDVTSAKPDDIVKAIREASLSKQEATGTSILDQGAENIQTPEFTSWFKDSKVVDEAGAPLVVYHGTAVDIPEFSFEHTDKGNDSFGSGFYFSDKKEVASGYAGNAMINRGGSSGKRANVMPVYLSLQNPLRDTDIGNITEKQALAIIKQSPILDEALTNFGEVGVNGTKQQILKEAAQNYVVEQGEILRGLHPIANDFFRGRVKEFNQAVRDVLGYDGVIANMGESTEYVAWFPEQIKSQFNRGTFDQNNPNVLFQQHRIETVVGTEVNTLGFYSKMARVLAQTMNATGTPAQMKQQAVSFSKSGKFKPTELYWSGLEEWLDGLPQDQKITKQDVVNFLNTDGFKLVEVGESTEDLKTEAEQKNSIVTEANPRPAIVLQHITKDDFDMDRDSRYDEPDPSYIRETARDVWYDDIFKELEEKNNDLPEEDRDTEAKLEELAMEEAVRIAEQSALDDGFNYTTIHRLEVEGLPRIEVEQRGGDDYKDLIIDGEYQEQYNTWDQVIEAIYEHFSAQGIGFSYDPDNLDEPLINTVDPSKGPKAKILPKWDGWTGSGGKNYSFFRFLVPKLKTGELEGNVHYTEKNVFLHYRLKERTGPEGEPMLFIEEIQSDTHQHAYKTKQKLKTVAYLNELTPEFYRKLEAAYEDTKVKRDQSMAGYDRMHKELVADVEKNIPDIGHKVAPVMMSILQSKYNHTLHGGDTTFDADAIIEDKAKNSSVISKYQKALFSKETTKKVEQAIVDSVKSRYPAYDLPEFEIEVIKENVFRDIFSYYEQYTYVGPGTGITEPDAFAKDQSKRYAEAAARQQEYFNIHGIKAGKNENQNQAVASYAMSDAYAALALNGADKPEIKDARFVVEKMRELYKKYESYTTRVLTERDEGRIAYNESYQAIQAADAAVVQSPFHNSWREAALKRLIIRATQAGFKSIGWTTGHQQNVRYSLAQSIDSMEARKFGHGYMLRVGSGIGQNIVTASNHAAEYDSLENAYFVPDSAMDAVFSKANADIIRAQAGTDKSKPVNFDIPVEVGGERKASFYDAMIPNEFSSIMSKIDPSVKAIEVPYSIMEKGKDMGSIWYAKFTDAAIEKVKQGLELFQKEPEGINPRGSYNPSTKVITIFDGADLSTVLHELGHLWLDETRALAARSDINPEFKKDWEVLKGWLGIASDDMPFTVEQHEKFARGFEAYLREGKAPSVELQSIFDTFAAWLRRIYKSVSQLQVQLNDDVRGVFDRMLASSDEIENMKAQAEMFEDPAIIEMLTASEKETYMRRQEQARDRAKSELMARVMRDVEKKRTAQWREEADNVKREVEEHLKSDPIYQAITALSEGHFIGDPKNEKGMPRVKIDRKWFIDNYGVKPVYTVVKSETGKTWQVLKDGVKEAQFKSEQKAQEAVAKATEKAKNVLPADLPKHVRRALGVDGVTADVAADMIAPGTFQSGQSLIENMMKALPVKDFIEQQTAKIMDERYPDILNTDSITEEALKALNNEIRADILEQEHKAIAKRTNHKPFTKEMARAVAERILNQKKIRDLHGSYHYYRTGLQLARDAGKAIGRKDFEKAADLKKQQMINHYLYRLTKENEDVVDGTLKYLKKFTREGTRKKIAHEYLDQIDDLLEGYDLRRQSSEKTRSKREALQEFIKRMEEAGTPIDVPDNVIKDAYRTSYKDMALPDFLALRDTILGIEHLGRLKNKLLKAAADREYQSIVTEMVNTIKDGNPELAEQSLAPTIKERIGGTLSKWHAEHWKPEFIFRFLDGGKVLGPVWSAMFKPIAEAEATEQTMQKEYTKRLREIFKEYDRGETRAFFFTKPIWIEEIGASLTKDQIMSVALNWGNDYNKEALKEGYRWSDEQVHAIIDKLDEADINRVQQTWDLIDSLWPAAQALEKRLTGVAPEKVEASPFVTKFGVKRGGYYPVSFDNNRSERAFQRAEKGDLNAVFQNNFMKPMTKKGHLKERKGTGGQPLNLSTSVISNHIYQVIHDLTHREAAIDVLKLIRDERVQDAIISRAGKQAYRVLTPWLQRVVNERKVVESPVTRFFGRVRANSSIVIMGLKVTTAIQQPLGYLTTIDAIGAKYSGYGLKAFYGTEADGNPIENMKKQKEMVDGLSPFMADRSQTFDRDLRDSFQRMTRDDPFADNWKKSMFYLTQMVQAGVDYPTWLGAYSKGMNELFDGEQQKAIDYADSVVRTTQSSGSTKDLSQIQSGYGEAGRWFTMYYSYFNVLYNIIGERTSEFKRGQIGVPKLAASALFLWFMPVVLQAMVTGQGPSDDDDSYAEWLAGQLASFPFATIVGVRDIANAMFGSFDYRMTPVEQAIDTVIKGYKGAASGIADGEFKESTQKNLLYGIGYTFGLPSAQAWNMLDYMRDYVSGEKEGFSLYEFLVKKKNK